MTDKEIIIDGVDVSECDFLAKEDDYCSYSGEYRAYKGQCGCSDEEMCKNHPNCFYKKALKQLACKEQECEELKEDRERWKSNFNGKVSAIEELLQQLDQLKAKNIKIYKTLTEIKEIADKDFRHTAWEEYAKQLKQILQKISECKGEYNEKIRMGNNAYH